jgi:hypothetical protein
VGLGRRILLLVQDRHVRVINAAAGELLSELTLDPARSYQPVGKPPATRQKLKTPNPLSVGSGHSDVLRHHRARSEVRARRDSNPQPSDP